MHLTGFRFITAFLALWVTFSWGIGAAASGQRRSDSASQASAKANKTLAAKIDRLLEDPDLSRSFWGIQVVSLTKNRSLYALNADKLFIPASNTKLFTTAAVLALIGPSFKFHTTVETSGTLDKYGRISGDLSLVGRGDPNLSGRLLPYTAASEETPPATPALLTTRALDDLADQLVRKGVKYVDGDVVADDSYYVSDRFGEGWSQDDLLWDYGAAVSALAINDNVVFVKIMPGARAGDAAFITVDPFTDYYRLDNRIVTTAAGSAPRKLSIHRDPDSTQLALWGAIPIDDAGVAEALAIEDPAEFAARLFHSILEKHGITIYGGNRALHTPPSSLPATAADPAEPQVPPGIGGAEAASTAPPPATAPAKPPAIVLASYESLPLIEDLRLINKISQNLHAEMALRLLGRERGTSGSVQAGLEVMRGVLAQAGIDPQDYSLHDGSGLSRQNLVTPSAVVKLLQYAAVQPWAAQFQDTLPLAASDGSLKDRFTSTPAAGRVRGKTGGLDHVNALSGYATTATGDSLAYAILVNNHNLKGSRVKQVIDEIVEAMVEEGSPKKK